MNNWVLRVNPEVKAKVEKWLVREATTEGTIMDTKDVMLVSLTSIDDAFRFRIQFDESIVH